MWKVFHFLLLFITFGGHSAHLVYLVHKSGRKTSIIITIIITIITNFSGWKIPASSCIQPFPRLCIFLATLPVTSYECKPILSRLSDDDDDDDDDDLCFTATFFTEGQPECDENADTVQMFTSMVKSMKGLKHDTTLIRNKVSYIEEYLESVERKLDDCICTIKVLYDRQLEETKTQARFVDTMTELKDDTDAKLKAFDDKFTQQEEQSWRNNLKLVHFYSFYTSTNW